MVIMNSLQTVNSNLPATPKELAPFIAVGTAAVNAARKILKSKTLTQEQFNSVLTKAQEQGEIVIDAKAELGKFIKDTPSKSGERTDLLPSKQEVGKTSTFTYLGLTQRQASNYQTIAKNPIAVEKAKAIAKENNDIPTESLVLQIVRQKEKEERETIRQAEIKAQSKQKAKIPTDNYSCIVIDPPWNYGTQYDTNGRRVANPYPEMTFDQIAELKIKAKPDCIMFLWATHKFIWDAKKLLEKWGFEYRSIIVWDKEKMGMGDLFRMQCEFCLVGIKGKPLLNNPHNIRDIIKEPRREHSRKPEAFYKIVDTLYKGEKLEYFAREQRYGYAVYGNDTNKF